MGIVNVTPDSFSDGGQLADAATAIAHALTLVAQGAGIVDVGGESTRPGAMPVSEADEIARVVPVIEGLVNARCGARISIDTAKSVVASAALAAGATILNDVTALRGDPQMAALAAAAGCHCCLMHMQGEPRTMQVAPRYHDVLDEVRAFLEARLAFAVAAGIDERRVLLDPGIGFGKTVEHNLTLLRGLSRIAAIGRPVVIGTSRKWFLGQLLARGGIPAPPSQRLAGTIATNVLALEQGARVFRVHDVAPVRDALAVAAATLSGRWAGGASDGGS